MQILPSTVQILYSVCLYKHIKIFGGYFYYALRYIHTYIYVHTCTHANTSQYCADTLMWR